MPETRERWRYRLPHWEVAARPHFVTIRCTGSLPAEAADRLREVHRSLHHIESNSPEFAALQRKYFLICERYLDAGHGFCPFRERPLCEFVVTTFAELPTRSGWRVLHFSLMPNHVHLLAEPSRTAEPLKNTLQGWKWITAKEANRLLGRSGAFWQTDWFDRWSRNDSDTVRMRDYIRNNPVKAGLVTRWEDHPGTQ